MKTLYFECNMGAAGDMLFASLLELCDNPDDFLTKLNSVGIPGVYVSRNNVQKCGINGTHVTVTVGGKEEISDDSHTHEHSHNHEHSHDYDHSHGREHSHDHSGKHSHTHEHINNDYAAIKHLIGHLDVSDKVKADSLDIYMLIAKAESYVHGVEIEQIHFHEVGQMDAVADIVGVAMLIEQLGPQKIISSPINTGSGFVRCAHGLLPVPAPATAKILRSVPIYSDTTKGELCTPTGAAILKHYVEDYTVMPVMKVERIGYGMGTKDFEKANCVRAYWGDIESDNTEEIIELSCNLDDMTPEAIAFAAERLMAEGALDVYTTAIGMKKNRAGIMLNCLCKPVNRVHLLALIFKHTSTLGVREQQFRRYILEREQYDVETQYGRVGVKKSFGYGITKTKPEYEDLARIAFEQDLTISDVIANIEL